MSQPQSLSEWINRYQNLPKSQKDACLYMLDEQFLSNELPHWWVGRSQEFGLFAFVHFYDRDNQLFAEVWRPADRTFRHGPLALLCEEATPEINEVLAERVRRDFKIHVETTFQLGRPCWGCKKSLVIADKKCPTCNWNTCAKCGACSPNCQRNKGPTKSEFDVPF